MRCVNSVTTKKPNTFIVGAPKSGTSAMASYLSEHPNVFVSNPKEPFFWCEDYEKLRRRNGMTSLADYLQLFENATHDHQVILEGSTNYLASKVAIRKIIDFEPHAKFVVMLRNPVEVVHAFHSEVAFAGIEPENDFEKAWSLQVSRRKNPGLLDPQCEAPQFLQYAEVANYPVQLERLLSSVPKKNIKIILYDDLVSDNRTCFDELIQFLGLAKFEKQEFAKVNASHDHRFKTLSNLVLNPPRILQPAVEGIRAFARQYRGGLVEKLKMMCRKHKTREPLTQSMKSRLDHFFRSQTLKTGMLIGRDLSCWLSSPTVNSEPMCRDRTNEPTTIGGIQ